MNFSSKVASIYRWIAESQRGIMIVLFIVFLAIFNQYSQNGRYRYVKMPDRDKAYVIDSRTGEVSLGGVSTEKYYAYERQLEAAEAATQAKEKAKAWDRAKAAVHSNYEIGQTFTPDDLRPIAMHVAEYYGVPKDLLLGITAAASEWNPVAKNPTSGALGLEQFTDDKAKNYFTEPLTGDANDPRYHPGKSLDASARYLNDLYAKYGNWPEAVMHYGDNTPAYLEKVKRAAAREADLLSNSKKRK